MGYTYDKNITFRKTDVVRIIKWNDGKTSNFLYQWAGRGYEYPITEKQISDRIEAAPVLNYKLYKIVLDDDMIGTIELMNIDLETKTAKIGRYLLNPGRRVYAECNDDNINSIKLLERLNFRRERYFLRM